MKPQISQIFADDVFYLCSSVKSADNLSSDQIVNWFIHLADSARLP